MNTSDANKAAIDQIIKDDQTSITVRQVKYLNNIIEQDHRAVKRITRPMLGFKPFDSTQGIQLGIKLIQMLRNNQFNPPNSENMNF